MSARARARAIEAIEIETEMDIAMLSEANEADKARPFRYLSQLGQVERTKFLVDQGEVPVSVWVDAWLRRAKLREFLKAKAKAEGRRVMWLEE